MCQNTVLGSRLSLVWERWWVQLCALATRLEYFRHGQGLKHTCNSQDGLTVGAWGKQGTCLLSFVLKQHSDSWGSRAVSDCKGHLDSALCEPTSQHESNAHPPQTSITKSSGYPVEHGNYLAWKKYPAFRRTYIQEAFIRLLIPILEILQLSLSKGVCFWHAGCCKLQVLNASSACTSSLFFCLALLWNAAWSWTCISYGHCSTQSFDVPHTLIRLLVLLHLKENWELKKSKPRHDLCWT